MRNKKETFRKIVGFLNNPEEDGGFWLPHIQRSFVWSEEQIYRLFDSMLRQYPIGTLLVWKTTSDARHRKFIDNWKGTLRLSDFNVPQNNRKKNLVLDGQQRLQSLFIGLNGSYEGKELYFDVLSGQDAAPDDIKYRFRFLETSAAVFPWVRFKDLVMTTLKQNQLLARIRAHAGRTLTRDEEDKLNDHLDLIDVTFKMDEGTAYQELDSIDNAELYREDDVVEVFIRANSGGTKLGKSDLLFALLAASWEVANERMEELLERLNAHGFAYDRDFVLKTCLVLLDQGARYEVTKFRKPNVREDIEAAWDEIASAICDIADFVSSKTYIQCDRALPSYLALIPLIYVRYHFPDAWRRAREVETYLLRVLLAGAFGGQPDNLIDALVRKLRELEAFDREEAFSVIRSEGRSLELTEDRFWEMGYGSKYIHLLFNLWYPGIEYQPAYDNNLPEVDHVFPKGRLAQVKVTNPETGRPVMRYREDARNQLANCELLRRQENGPGGKGDQLPSEWFADKDEAYLDLHLIPKDRSLWELDEFEGFLDARKDLIRQRFKFLLVPRQRPGEGA